MAEFTAARNNALPYPIYGLPFTVTFPLLDADGDPISPSSQDSEISKNCDTFADCTNEAVEIATSSGSCYLSLTGTELTCDIATIQVKSTGAKTTVLSLYPRKLVSIRANTSASAGSSTSTIVLDASASAIDDFYNGMVCSAVIDGTTEVRLISDYTGSSQTATVVPDWNTAPDNNDTFTIYLPEGVQLNQANATHWNHLVTVELPLVPTTAGRKLDVSAGGEAGLDWANIGSPTTAQNLSGTNIDVDQIVASVSGAVGSVTGAVGSVTGAVGSVTGAVGSVTGAVGSVTGNVGGNVAGSVASVTAGVTVTTNNDKTAYVLSATGSAALTEGYAADGAAFTLNQGLYMIWSLLAERAISGTTVTASKLDGATPAMTFTLDDAVTPATQTRAT